MPIYSPQTSVQNPDQDMSNDLMCSACQSLLVRPNETIDKINPALYDFGTIARSATDGCPICKIFHSNLRSYDVRDFGRLSVKVNYSNEFFHAQHNSERDGELARAIQLQMPRSHGSSKLRITLLPSLNLGNQDCLSQAAAWMQNCIVNHKRCNAHLGTTCSATLPARALHVSGTNARLVQMTHIDTKIITPYLTVSHKWMTQGMPKLLRCNLQKMQQSVQLHTLPAIFQDSILLARAIGICYVWIDSLCIIQDDSRDIETEISKMGQIYRNAILNVGALKTSHVAKATKYEHTGLFVDRNCQEPSAFQLTIQRINSKRDYFAHVEERGDFLNASPLMERGWVLQERLLSRRSIYFGSQAWWECGEQLATNQYPHGLPEYMQYGGFYGVETPYRITTILNPPKHYSHYDARVPHLYYIYKSWDHIVTSFSRRKLTFEQDYLPALSGIAQEFQIALKENYYAGLWERYMIRGLLWFRACRGFRGNRVRTQEYRGM
jgi:hypothetical protein